MNERHFTAQTKLKIINHSCLCEDEGTENIIPLISNQYTVNGHPHLYSKTNVCVCVCASPVFLCRVWLQVWAVAAGVCPSLCRFGSLLGPVDDKSPSWAETQHESPPENTTHFSDTTAQTTHVCVCLPPVCWVFECAVNDPSAVYQTQSAYRNIPDTAVSSWQTHTHVQMI